MTNAVAAETFASLCNKGRILEVVDLLEAGASQAIIDAPGTDGMRPLALASFRGDSELVQLLLLHKVGFLPFFVT
jgi:ankyrin repeat protein